MPTPSVDSLRSRASTTGESILSEERPDPLHGGVHRLVAGGRFELSVLRDLLGVELVVLLLGAEDQRRDEIADRQPGASGRGDRRGRAARECRDEAEPAGEEIVAAVDRRQVVVELVAVARVDELVDAL